MSDKTHIRIEGFAESDELIKRLCDHAKSAGLRPTTMARMFMRQGMDQYERDEVELSARRAGKVGPLG